MKAELRKGENKGHIFPLSQSKAPRLFLLAAVFRVRGKKGSHLSYFEKDVDPHLRSGITFDDHESTVAD